MLGRSLVVARRIMGSDFDMELVFLLGRITLDSSEVGIPARLECCDGFHIRRIEVKTEDIEVLGHSPSFTDFG